MNKKRMTFIAGAVLSATAFVYLALLIKSVSDLDAYSRDFSAHYTAATLVLKGFGERLYDLSLQREFFPHPPQLFLPYYHPAFGVVPFFIVGFLPFAAAFHGWNLLNVLFSIFCVKLLAGTYFRTSDGCKPPSAWKLGLFWLAFSPAWNTLANGQNSLLFMLILSAGCFFYYQQKYFRTGLLMALMLIKPQLGIPLALSFAFRSPAKFLFGFGSGVFACFFATLGILRLEGFSSLLQMITELKANQAEYGLHYDHMTNLAGSLSRHVLGKFTAAPALVSILIWGLMAAGVAFLSYREQKAHPGSGASEGRFFDARIFIFAALASVHMNDHDFVVLFFPAALIFFEACRQKRTVLALISFSFFTPILLLFFNHFPDGVVLLELILLAALLKGFGRADSRPQSPQP